MANGERRLKVRDDDVKWRGHEVWSSAFMRSGWLNAPNRLKAELQTGCWVWSSAFMRSGRLNAPNRLKAELQTGIPPLSPPSPQGVPSG